MSGGRIRGRRLARYFVAIPLPALVRSAIDDWRQELDLPGRAVPPSNLHVTLRFVGPASVVGVERLMSELDAAELGDPFSFRIGGLGGFPKLRKATVGWAAIEEDRGKVADLAGMVEEAVAAAGFGYEDRPFKAHLTLARIRPPRDLRRHASRGVVRIRVPVNEVVLYQSRTGGRAVVYDVRERFPLGDSGR